MRFVFTVSTLAVAFVALGLVAAGCVDDSKNAPPPLPTPDVGLPLAPTSDAEPPTVTPVVDAAIPIIDAGPDGASFATGLGPGAVVTKSAKYTLITKTGGSPGGSGVSHSPSHTVVSGAAANAKP